MVFAFPGDWKNLQFPSEYRDGVEWKNAFWVASDAGILEIALDRETLWQSSKGLIGNDIASVAVYQDILFGIHSGGEIVQFYQDHFVEKHIAYSGFGGGVKSGVSLQSGKYWILVFADALAFFNMETLRSELSITRLGSSELSESSISRLSYLDGKLSVQLANGKIYAIAFDNKELADSKGTLGLVNHADPNQWLLNLSIPIDPVDQELRTYADSLGGKLILGTKSWVVTAHTIKVNDSQWRDITIKNKNDSFLNLVSVAPAQADGAIVMGERGLFQLDLELNISNKFLYPTIGYDTLIENGDTVINSLTKNTSTSGWYANRGLKGVTSYSDDAVAIGNWALGAQIIEDGSLKTLSENDYCYEGRKANFVIVPEIKVKDDGLAFLYWGKDLKTGLAFFDGKEMQCFYDADHPEQGQDFLWEEDKLWITGRDEIFEFKVEDSFTFIFNKKYNSSDLGLLNNIQKDQNNNIWVSGEYGIGLVCSSNSPAKICRNVVEDSLVSIHNKLDIPISETHGFEIDSNNTLWWGTAEAGLYSINVSSLKWTQYTTKAGLISNSVRDLAIGNYGRLWVVHSNGISVLHTKGRESAAFRSKNKIRPFPNPYYANKHSTLRFEAIPNGFSVRIYSEAGQIIKSFASQNIEGGYLEWMPPSSLRYGLYYWVAVGKENIYKGKWVFSP